MYPFTWPVIAIILVGSAIGTWVMVGFGRRYLITRALILVVIIYGTTFAAMAAGGLFRR